METLVKVLLIVAVVLGGLLFVVTMMWRSAVAENAESGRVARCNCVKEISMAAIELGDTARDEVSGYEGIVVAEVNYYRGSPQLQLHAKNEPGKPAVEAQWFDRSRVILVSQLKK